MRSRLGKKAMEIPLHWLIIFVVMLIILIIIAYSAFTKSGGLIGGIFGAMRGG